MIRDLDIHITKTCNKLTTRNKSLTSFLKIFTHSSSGVIYIFYLILIPLILPQYGLDIIQIGVIGFGFQVPIYLLSKNLIKRERPYINHNISALISPPDKYSFPSGHCIVNAFYAYRKSVYALANTATSSLGICDIFFKDWTWTSLL